MKATERDEVKSFGSLEPLQAIGHVSSQSPCDLVRRPAHRDKPLDGWDTVPDTGMSGPPAVSSRSLSCLRV